LLNYTNLEFLLKEHILKSDVRILPLSSFTIVHLFTITANLRSDNTTFSPLIQQFTQIKDLNKFIGFDIIYKFNLLTRNKIIYQQSLSVLMNILELTSQNVENRNAFISKIFDFIEK
jgi:hypothetical protein